MRRTLRGLLLSRNEAVRRVPNHSGFRGGRLLKDCGRRSCAGKVTMILDPDLHSSRCGDLRQFSNGLRDPTLRGGPVRARLDRVTENSKARRSQFRSQICHPFSFGDPTSAFGCIGRMKSATCVQARDVQSAIRQCPLGGCQFLS